VARSGASEVEVRVSDAEVRNTVTIDVAEQLDHGAVGPLVWIPQLLPVVARAGRMQLEPNTGVSIYVPRFLDEVAPSVTVEVAHSSEYAPCSQRVSETNAVAPRDPDRALRFRPLLIEQKVLDAITRSIANVL